MDKEQVTIGILAHVDAGKTTLAECMMYLTGQIRKLGRVDHKDAFLDTNELERARGITIFSKEARFQLGEKVITLLDTPGHIDFQGEMERTLQILDYVILVVSGADGVQGHVLTLWRLLEEYKIPVFLFINKMDQEGTHKEKLLKEIRERLHEHCIDFSNTIFQETILEEIAMCDENVLEQYLESGKLGKEDMISLISRRKLFPCYFGSALKVRGVDAFLEGLNTYTKVKAYGKEFGAKVFKIARDLKGNRLTYLKVTGGSLKVRELIKNGKEDGIEEKINEIRIYSGNQYTTIQEAKAGTVCAITGLSKTYSLEGLGVQEDGLPPHLIPVLTYQIQLPKECDIHEAFLKLCQLEEEEPQLHIIWNEQLNEIHAQVMGEVQIEILKSIIKERFGFEVTFGKGNIVYKETILGAVEGVGHYEPLRHYAEVHLLLEPGERGSGVVVLTDCREDMLDGNWQRLICTHVEEKCHKGVVIGAEITDVKITLVAGRAHLKHTEGGDFRQATYRAIRQGLKKAKCMVLEPVYEYRLEIPTQMVGRSMSDIQRMKGTFQDPENIGEVTIIKGTAPVVTMQGYQTEVMAYTKGSGRLHCSLKGYEPCHNQEEVIESIGYDSQKDLDHPTGSVFCAHGAGFVVSWDQVESYMHVESEITKRGLEKEKKYERTISKNKEKYYDEEELKAIFERTYGTVKKETGKYKKRVDAKDSYSRESYFSPLGSSRKQKPQKEYLLVDGYNIIFAWEELKNLAKDSIEGARNKLLDILCNYQGYKKNTVIVVFDAYKVEGGKGEVALYHNIHVVYTKEAETADQYIEKTVHEMGKKYQVTVATSDALEQLIILGSGGNRLSAMDLKEEIERMKEEITTNYLSKPSGTKNYLLGQLPEDVAEFMEDVRLGKKEFKDESV